MLSCIMREELNNVSVINISSNCFKCWNDVTSYFGGIFKLPNHNVCIIEM